MYTLDTNAIIYYLKDDRSTVPILRDIFKANIPVYISSLTEAELFSFSNLTTQEEDQIEKLLKTVAIIPVDSRIARIAGSFRRQFDLKLSDSVIAATAKFTGSVLLTRNIRDFEKIPNLLIKKI